MTNAQNDRIRALYNLIGQAQVEVENLINELGKDASVTPFLHTAWNSLDVATDNLSMAYKVKIDDHDMDANT